MTDMLLRNCRGESRAHVGARASAGESAPSAVNDLNQQPISAARAVFAGARRVRALAHAFSYALWVHSLFSLSLLASTSPVAVTQPGMLRELLHSQPAVQPRTSPGGHAARVAAALAPAARGNLPA